MSDDTRIAAKTDAELAAEIAVKTARRRGGAGAFRRPRALGRDSVSPRGAERYSPERTRVGSASRADGTAPDAARTATGAIPASPERPTAGSARASASRADGAALDTARTATGATGSFRASGSAPHSSNGAAGGTKRAHSRKEHTRRPQGAAGVLAAAKEYVPAAAYFALTAVLSATPFTYGTYPFGLALFCAASGTRCAAASLLGVVAGSVFAEGGAYVTLVAIVIAFARFAIGSFGKRRVIRFASLDGEASGGDRVFAGETPPGTVSRSGALDASLLSASLSSVPSGAAGKAENTPSSALLFAEDLPVRCALASAGAMVTGGLGMIFHQSVWRGVAAMALSAAVAPILCAAYSGFFRRRSRRAFFACTLATAFSASWLLTNVSIASFNLAPAFALIVSFAAAHFLALPEALLAALAVSLPLEFAVIPAILLATGAYSLVRRQFPTLASTAGVLAALFFSLGAIGMTAASRYGAEFLVAAALSVPLCRTLARLPEYLPSALSRRVRSLFGELSPDERRYADLGTERAVTELRSLADCFTALGELAKDVTRALASPSETELRERVERSFERKCASCRRRNECDAAGDAPTYRRALARAIKKGRGVSSVAAPRALSARCPELSSIVRSVSPNGGETAVPCAAARDLFDVGAILKSASERLGADSEYDSAASRRLRRELSLAGVFADEVSVVSPRLRLTHIAGIEPSSLHAGADDLRVWVARSLGVDMTEPRIAISPDGTLDISLHARERFRVVMGKCSLSATAAPCGDSASAFVTPDGRFAAVISDGMGSGSEAAFTAGTVTLFLERLLTAGVDMAAALRMTNSFLCSRRIECSATVDVAQIDLVRGGAGFYKSGAAPSFVLREGKLFALRSKTVPIGILPSADAEGISFEVAPGDVIVMASDGVTREGEDCPWMYEALCSENMTNLTAAAKNIADQARLHCGDDITVMLLRIESA